MPSTLFRWLSSWNMSQILWLYQSLLWKRYEDRIKLFQSSRWLLDNKWNVTNCEWVSSLILAKYVTNSHLLHSDWLSSDRISDYHYFLPFLSLQHMNYSDNTQLSSKSGWVWADSVWYKERESSTCHWSVEVGSKISNTYLWERDKVSTSCNCNVTSVVKCIWKIHIVDPRHV